MNTMTDFAEYASTKPNRKADREVGALFKKYCNEYYAGVGDLPLNQFGDIEFLQYQAYLVKVKKPHKTIYNHIVALRRMMGKAHNDGHEFDIHPRYFSAPQKPEADHFDPLSSEELETLESFLKREIKVIYEREAKCKEALKNGKPILETGATFKKTPSYKPSESFWKWQKPLKDCIMQYHLESPNFPHNTTLEQLAEGGEYASITKVDYDLLNTPFKLTYKRMGVQRIKASGPFLYDAPDLGNIDVMGILYPRIFEVYVITWAICLETG